MNDFVPTLEQAAQTRQMMRDSITRTYQVLQKLHPAFSDNRDHWTRLADISPTGETLMRDLDALPNDAPYAVWEALNTRIVAWHHEALRATEE